MSETPADDPVESVRALVAVAVEFGLGYITLDTDAVSAVLDRLKNAELEYELREARANYQSACCTIAAMHAAAVGEDCAPGRGVVEDIADLRERCLAAEEALETTFAQLGIFIRFCGFTPSHTAHKWTFEGRTLTCLGVVVRGEG